MNVRNMEYFRIVKELNTELHEELINKKLHFRGNENSFSLISVAKETAERGKSGLKDKNKAIKLIQNGIIIEEPNRDTPEKVLQAWIINFAMNNNWALPFDNNILYLTSELALKVNEKKIVNDILAIDYSGNLCIVELKSKRDNYVKKQTEIFEKFVNNEKDFFEELLNIISPIKWNGKIRKIAVWPKAEGKIRKAEYPNVEEINYIEKKVEYIFE